MLWFSKDDSFSSSVAPINSIMTLIFTPLNSWLTYFRLLQLIYSVIMEDCFVSRVNKKTWTKLDMPNSVTYVWVVCDMVWLQEQIPKRRVFNRDWTVCSKYNNHLTSAKVFTLIAHEIFIWAPKVWRKWLWPWFEFANHLILVACFISYKKQAHSQC